MDELILRSENGKLTAEPVCEIDHFRAVKIREEIDHALYRERPETLELRLGRVDFMDSSGIGVLLGRYRILAERGGSMDVVNAGRTVERILRMAGVYKLCTKEEKADEE